MTNSNYVALHLKYGSGIYGVAIATTAEEHERLMSFAEDNKIQVTTGAIYSPDDLIEHAKMHYRYSS